MLKSTGNVTNEKTPGRTDMVFARGTTAHIRSQFQDNDDFFCEMCGIVPGDIDDITGRRAKFRVAGTGIPKDMSDLSSVRVLCSTCDRGVRQITVVKPTAIWLLSQVRRAGQDEQRAVLSYLLKKFGQEN